MKTLFALPTRILLLLNLCSSPAVAEEIAVSGRVVEVTVYRDQARVIRDIEVPASDKPQQIRVLGLPVQLVEDSSFTEAGEGTQVLSHQVISQNTVDEQVANELAADLNEMRAAKEAAENHLEIIRQDMSTLERLVTFSADKIQQNLDRATLEVQSVTALADFVMERRRILAQELFTQQAEVQALKHQIAERQKQPTKTPVGEVPYEAIITVRSDKGGLVRLSYDVEGVHWYPRYKINGQLGRPNEVAVQMEAVVVQHSGESWQDVSLTLATSTPQTQAAGPSLAPLRIHTAALRNPDASTHVLGQFTSAAQSELLHDELAALTLELNMEAGRQQIQELTSTEEVQRNVAMEVPSRAFDETYELAGKVSLASHTQPQTLAILRASLEAEFYHVATPLLSSFAFRETSLINESGKSFIDGQADVYLDEKFVGRVEIPPTAVGQRMTIGFGTDRQVRTRRELLSRKEAIKGGNRFSELACRLVISNFHVEPVEIRLLDRIPLAVQDDSINITLTDEELARLSSDPLYQRLQQPTGILRWDITVPGNRFGSQAYDHEYKYSIEHDREQTVASEDLMQRMMEDLEFESIHGGMGGMGGGFGGGSF
ncbi:MAG: DUF4139 domain-containing protein [Planctomycetales bacterium]|nr:DUF4139 domain-containing protein [Planctomycetales bacterium]